MASAQAFRNAPDAAYYEAGGDVPEAVSREQVKTTRHWLLERVHVPARVPGDLAIVPRSTDAIELLHWKPRVAASRKRPLILMSPILGNTTMLVDRFAAYFARVGFHAVIVQRKELDFHPTQSLELAEAEYRTLVMRSRQALDWLIEQEGIDETRLGTFGVSAGAIISSLVAGADSRLRGHVWMLPGAPLSDVMIDTVEDPFRTYVRDTMKATGLNKGQLRERLTEIMVTDPLILADRVDTSRVLLFLARFDRSVPTASGLALWKALGRPELVMMPTGHYTTFVVLPWLKRRARAHFERVLGGP